MRTYGFLFHLLPTRLKGQTLGCRSLLLLRLAEGSGLRFSNKQGVSQSYKRLLFVEPHFVAILPILSILPILPTFCSTCFQTTTTNQTRNVEQPPKTTPKALQQNAKKKNMQKPQKSQPKHAKAWNRRRLCFGQLRSELLQGDPMTGLSFVWGTLGKPQAKPEKKIRLLKWVVKSWFLDFWISFLGKQAKLAGLFKGPWPSLSLKSQKWKDRRTCAHSFLKACQSQLTYPHWQTAQQGRPPASAWSSRTSHSLLHGRRPAEDSARFILRDKLAAF